MKRILEQLSENVFGDWRYASVLIYKAVSGAAWNRLSHYLIRNLAGGTKSFDITFADVLEDDRHAYGNTIYKGENATANEMHQSRRNNDKEENRQDIGFAISGGDDRREHYPGNGSRDSDIDDDIMTDAGKINPSVVVSEIVELVKNNVERTDFITDFAKQNIIFKITEGLTDAVLDSVIPNTAIAVNRYFGSTGEGIMAGDKSDIYIEGNAANKQRIINGIGNLSVSRNIYHTDNEYLSSAAVNITDRQSDSNRIADIGYIEDALARKLHEQIASGFPMYMG